MLLAQRGQTAAEYLKFVDAVTVDAHGMKPYNPKPMRLKVPRPTC